MVWPIKPDGVAICENVRSEAHEGQSQRYQFTKTQRAVERIECSIAAFAGTYKAGSSRPRRKMSAAARARISAAQKARWAKTKGQKVFPIKAGKRRISAAGLARIRAANRARWARLRAAKK